MHLPTSFLRSALRNTRVIDVTAFRRDDGIRGIDAGIGGAGEQLIVRDPAGLERELVRRHER